MASFKINVTNSSTRDSFTLAPVEGWEDGTCIPPLSTVGFLFQSPPETDSITLALSLISEQTGTAPCIARIKTDGGICQIQCEESIPRLMEITNLCDQCITEITVNSGRCHQNWLDRGIRQKL